MKDQSEKPEGEIISAYCTCTAGMYGTSNHIAGLLFRCEHAVKTGATKIACTSKSATWVVAKGKQLLNYAKAKDVVWKKSHYLTSPTDRQAEVMARKMKQAFTPLTKKKSEDVKDGAKMRVDLHTLLAPDIPDSCFSLTMEGRRHENKSIELPKTIIELSKETLTSDELKSKKSPWCNGYGVRLATERSRVRSPPWERSLDLSQRHQVLVLGPGNGLDSVYISLRLSMQSS
ncbi:hypothetical protein DPMN_150334 [Dreissena polymorpha]|uniref:Uncharacterized protein n=1 Tax=Dreissena polymorpha TaxID=45954 RepID=A0A9D4FD96_DREPO|nr:hypothetical protein DPMN_150334 [Dreissena polymorpha]